MFVLLAQASVTEESDSEEVDKRKSDLSLTLAEKFMCSLFDLAVYFVYREICRSRGAGTSKE